MRNLALFLTCVMALFAVACSKQETPKLGSVDSSNSKSSGNFQTWAAALKVQSVADPNNPTATVWQTQDCTPTDDPNCNAEGPGQILACGTDTKKCTYYESDKNCSYPGVFSPGENGYSKTCTFSSCIDDQDCISTAKTKYADYFPNPDDSKTWLMNLTCIHTQQSVAVDNVQGTCLFAFASCSAGKGVCAVTGKSTCSNGSCSCSVTSGDDSKKLPEACNGVDDDCDGSTDEVDAQGCVNYYTDSDGDGFGAGSTTCKCTKGATDVLKAGDCNDSVKAVNPDATEACNSGVDDDCDGKTDEGFTYDDLGSTKNLGDSCGKGACADGTVQCAANGQGTTCSSSSKASNEACNGKDDNCDGLVDNGLEPKIEFFKDADGDKHGAGVASIQCGPFNGYVVTIGDDCDDTKSSVSPDATEACNSGVDDDCDGKTDEGFTYDDLGSTKNLGDSCGKGACANGKVQCTSNGQSATCSTIDKVGTESCNGTDDNCDGKTDEGVLLPFYKDVDADKYGDLNSSVMACLAPQSYVADKTDCNDSNKAAFPGGTELCDGVDNDCDSSTDEGCDDDNDGYCDTAMAYLNGAACKAGDCNDADGKISPKEADSCDGVDNNCDGNTDQKSDGGGGMISSCNQCLNVIEVDCDTEYTVQWPSSPATSLIDTYQCTSGPTLKIKLTAAEVMLTAKAKEGYSKFSLQILTSNTGTVAARLHGSCSPNEGTTAVSYYDPAVAAKNMSTGTCAAIGMTSVAGGVIGQDNVVLDAVSTKPVKVKFVCSK